MLQTLQLNFVVFNDVQVVMCEMVNCMQSEYKADPSL